MTAEYVRTGEAEPVEDRIAAVRTVCESQPTSRRLVVTPGAARDDGYRGVGLGTDPVVTIRIGRGLPNGGASSIVALGLVWIGSLFTVTSVAAFVRGAVRAPAFAMPISAVMLVVGLALSVAGALASRASLSRLFFARRLAVHGLDVVLDGRRVRDVRALGARAGWGVADLVLEGADGRAHVRALGDDEAASVARVLAAALDLRRAPSAEP